MKKRIIPCVVDEDKMYEIVMETKGFLLDKIRALASTKELWIKTIDAEESK